MSKKDYYNFGLELFRIIKEKPFGSFSKREMELGILQAAIDSNVIGDSPSAIARDLRLTMTKAHGYLTDLALRNEPLEDKEALKELSDLLNNAEIIKKDEMLLMPVRNIQLCLWIERSLAEGGLIQGESIRRDVLKLSPRALAYLFSYKGGIPSPGEALRVLRGHSKQPWYSDFQKAVNKGYNWQEILEGAAYATKKVIPLVLKSIP